jgi:hypothetical protein
MRLINKPLAFIWDKGNKDKSWLKHKVTIEECEEVFFDENKNEYPDPEHSTHEVRKILVGKTKGKRILFIVYTVRKHLIRVISARDLNKRREADLYEETT